MKIIKKFQESDGRRGFFLKYFTSFLIIFLIPLFLAFFTYNTAADIISAQCNNQVRNMLQQTKDITDSRLKELKSIPLTLDKNEYIMKFHQEWIQTNSTGNIFTAYKASHSIPKYDIINSSVENIRLFFGKPACCFIIGVDNAVRYTQDLSNLYWDDTAINYASFNQYLQDSHFYEQFMTIPSTDPYKPNIYFLSNLNSFQQNGYTSVIVIKLSNQFFTDMLQNITLDGCGTSFILTEENDIISYYQENNSFNLTEENLSEIIELSLQENDGSFQYDNNQVNITRSAFNGWTYYSLIPQSVIIKDLTAMRRLIILVTLLVIIVGIFCCYILTKRNSKPLKNIINELTSIYEYGYFDSTDHFKFLENAVSALIDRNSSYQQMLDDEVLRKLLLGEHTRHDEFQKQLSKSTILLNEKPYITVYLHIHNAKESEVPLQTLIKRLKSEFSGQIYPLIIDESNMVFLAVPEACPADSTFPIYMKELLKNLGNVIMQETNCHIDFFLSELMLNYENVHKSYEQCKRIAHNVYKKSDLFVYSLEDLPPFQQIYHYTIDQEIKLVQLIQHGCTEKLKDFLDELYKENFETLILSEGMKSDLIAAIQKSVQRNLSVYQSDNRIGRLLEYNYDNTIESLYIWLFELKEAIQNYVTFTAKTEAEKINYTIIDYIQKNYGNCNLNLSYMCRELKISEQAMSKFFQELGCSFSAILEKVRIEAACEMLSDKSLTIKAISEKVGYSSDVSFRRAFKRVLGISPSEFIKKNSIQSE
ncbi:AraC-type DNA-binding protein [Lachnospiraceae bacterium NLAE-zl-G231]|nr:AraC-type DNA-binding protein [Lachnospiraceae bacterium NLAE-zl-G231]